MVFSILIYDMRIRTKIFIVLAIYVSQLLLAPIIHSLCEMGEMDCADCYAGEVVNSSCSDQDGPCKNPAHHHHSDHSHDPAHCSFCKTFFQDIEFGPNCYGIMLKCISIASQSAISHSGTLSDSLFLIRAPPHNNFLT